MIRSRPVWLTEAPRCCVRGDSRPPARRRSRSAAPAHIAMKVVLDAYAVIAALVGERTRAEVEPCLLQEDAVGRLGATPTLLSAARPAWPPAVSRYPTGITRRSMTRWRNGFARAVGVFSPLPDSSMNCRTVHINRIPGREDSTALQLTQRCGHTAAKVHPDRCGTAWVESAQARMAG